MATPIARPAVVALVALGLLGIVATSCSWTDNDTRSATAGLPDVGQALIPARGSSTRSGARSNRWSVPR